MGIPGSANPLLLVQQGSTQYTVSRSIRLNSSDSAYLSRTPSSAGNRKKWTWAGWVKRVVIGQAYEYLLDAGVADNFGFTANSAYAYFGSGALAFKQSSAAFRDPGAWLHYLINFDSANSTTEDRCQIWINGVRLTSWSSNPTIPLNFESNINSTSTHTMCHALGYSFMSTYLADIHFIDGQALTPSSFTEVSATTGQLIPKAYTGSYGTNGFKLDFSNNASTTTVSQDSSGNNNHWTANNISVTAGAGNDSLVDTPTSYGTDTGAGNEVRGNYCTWNPLAPRIGGTLANGNLDAGTTSNGSHFYGSINVSTGKWYWEVTASAMTFYPGIANSISDVTTYWVYHPNGNFYLGGTIVGSGAAWTTGDVIGCALNMDAGTLVFYKNGVSQGTAFSGLSSTYFPFVRADVNGSFSANFGQRPFAYPVSGFKALCDTNLPTPVVAKPSTVFDTKLYTGNGSSQTVSGLGFSPDFVWLKSRTNANWHELNDTVRGAGKILYSNATDAEVTAGRFTAFTSDGFSVSTTGGDGTNFLNAAMVAWAWDAGSSTVTNTQGSITSTVRANASAGFSIVTWTAPSSGSGWTVGHGLGAAPFLMIDKCRSNTGNWTVYHQAQGATKALYLNTTDSVQTSSMYWNDTAPSSTVFTCGTTGWYGAGFTHVTYCFAPVVGYSSFGSFVSNGSANNVFVYTGFRPRFLVYKSSSVAGSWIVIDSSRAASNVVGPFLAADTSGAEGSVTQLDLLSNGFKCRDAGFQNGTTYIYFAFAESPFQYARAR